jgi:pimeloyl-ACP methyl ester carboxylesterase
MKFPHAARLTRLRFVLLAAVLAVAGLFAATAQIASASPSRAAAGPKPTIVLEHGAWADSGSWNGVVQRLQHDGYKVYAPPDPLRGLAYDTATLKDFLGTIPGHIVLVGHSYGGMVITNAATGNKNVKALVYDAFIPAKGDTAGSLSGARPGSCLAVANPATVFNLVPFPGAPKGVVDAYVKPSVFPSCFANGLPASEGAVLAATQRPLATSVLTDKSGVPAWKTIPSWPWSAPLTTSSPRPSSCSWPSGQARISPRCTRRTCR